MRRLIIYREPNDFFSDFSPFSPLFLPLPLSHIHPQLYCKGLRVPQPCLLPWQHHFRFRWSGNGTVLHGSRAAQNPGMYRLAEHHFTPLQVTSLAQAVLRKAQEHTGLHHIQWQCTMLSGYAPCQVALSLSATVFCHHLLPPLGLFNFDKHPDLKQREEKMFHFILRFIVRHYRRKSNQGEHFFLVCSLWLMPSKVIYI